MVTTKTLTVNKINIDPAFASAKAEDCTLSILYQRDGLSFLVRHSRTRQLLMFGYEPHAGQGVDVVTKVLESFSERPAVVNFAIEERNTIILPTVMVEQEKVPNWAETFLGTAPNFQDQNPKHLMSFFAQLGEEVLGQGQGLPEINTLQPRHHWAMLSESNVPSSMPAVHAHIFPTEVLITASDQGQWQLINSFDCSNERDLLYHVGNTTEQLGYDRTKLQLDLSGFSAKAYLPVLEPYFKNVKLAKSQGLVQISSSMREVDALEHYMLMRL